MRRSLTALALAASATLGAERALAQESPAESVGAIGGALLGTEIVVMSEALAGVDPVWAYVLGGGLAAVGGAYAGVLVTQESDPDVASWMVGAGFVLLLPTLVWVGDARSERTPPEPITIAGSPAKSAPPSAVRAEFPARPGLYLPIVSGTF